MLDSCAILSSSLHTVGVIMLSTQMMFKSDDHSDKLANMEHT